MEIQINIAPPRWGKSQKAISSYKQCYYKKEKCLMILHSYNSRIFARNIMIREDIRERSIMHQSELDRLLGSHYNKIIIDDFAYITQKNKDMLFNYLWFSTKKVEIWSGFECQQKDRLLLDYYKTGDCGSEYNNYHKNIFLKNMPDFLDKNLFTV